MGEKEKLSWQPEPQRWDRADCLLSAMLRAIRRQEAQVQVVQLRSSRVRMAATLRLGQQDGRRTHCDAAYYTVVLLGHALLTSADSTARRAFRSLAKRLAAGQLEQVASPYLVVRHGPAACVELVSMARNVFYTMKSRSMVTRRLKRAVKLW